MSVPKMRFKEDGQDFPEWEVSTIGERVTEKSSKFNPEKQAGNFNCIELEHLSQGTGELLGYVDVTKSKSIKNKFETGDVLFGKLRPYLRKFLKAPFSGVCSTEIWVLKGKEISNDFLFQFVQTENFITQTNVSSGSKMPRADWNVVSSALAYFPSINEQTKIANFLTAVDEKITQLTQKCDLLAQYKKSVMQQIFSQELRFKDDDGRDYPAWVEKVMGDVFTFIQTNSFSRELLNYEDGLVKNIHYGDIHTKFKSNFKIDNEKVPFVNPTVDLSKIPESCYCKEGDLVIADASEDYADVGKAIEISSLQNQKLLSGLHTYIARDLSKQMALGFSGYLMQTESVRLQIKILATGVSVLGISKGSLAKVKLKVPSKPEQTKIANFLTSIDDKINNAQTQLAAVKQYKQGLLQQMFV